MEPRTNAREELTPAEGIAPPDVIRDHLRRAHQLRSEAIAEAMRALRASASSAFARLARARAASVAALRRPLTPS